MQVALAFAYDGRFPGYARQPSNDTVEDLLIKALRREGYVDGTWRTGSRTDKGVAAAWNVAACEMNRPHARGLCEAVQSHLPPGIWMRACARVEEFDPRRAVWRDYHYIAPNQGEDLARMQQACKMFEGTHDMSPFARVEPHRDPNRTILEMTVSKENGWLFSVRGQSFLWNQIRRMVDAVLQVGRGRAPAEEIRKSLETGEKYSGFDLAPAQGLVLHRVVYDPELDWQLARIKTTKDWQRAHATATLMDAVAAQTQSFNGANSKR